VLGTMQLGGAAVERESGWVRVDEG
jgi:hypothetical protein